MFHICGNRVFGRVNGSWRCHQKLKILFSECVAATFLRAPACKIKAFSALSLLCQLRASFWGPFSCFFLLHVCCTSSTASWALEHCFSSFLYQWLNHRWCIHLASKSYTWIAASDGYNYFKHFEALQFKTGKIKMKFVLKWLIECVRLWMTGLQPLSTSVGFSSHRGF